MADLLPGPTRRLLERLVLPGVEGLRITRRRKRGLQLWRKFWLMDSAWRRARFALHYGHAWLQGLWLEWRARP